MTTFLGSYTRPRRRVLGEATRIGKLVGLSADSMSATVELAGETFELPVAPGKYVEDAYVSVLESKGKPRRVTGPAGVWPEGLDADAEAPTPVQAVRDLGPREFTPAEQAKLDGAVADLDVARDEIAAAVDQIGELATRVGFAWSGTFEATYPAGSDFRVEWTALGDGAFRFEMKNFPTGANFGWVFNLPGVSDQFPTTNPAIVTFTEPTSGPIYAWADDESVYVEVSEFVVRPEMMDSGPLQAAIASAAQAAVTASRIAPRSLNDPTPADGVDRPKNALWTKVNAQGEELAYWSWDGTEWVPQALSRTVIPLLDASHISTGTLDSDRVNATEIWASIATIGKIITEDLIAIGAVTAPALNVVHIDPVSGFGFRLDPEGLTILDRDGNPAIVLRADMTNYFSVVKDGVAQASISPDGEIVGQTVAANQSLEYRGIELEDRLSAPARGLIRRTRLTTSLTSDGAWCLLAEIKFMPVPGRAYSATIQYTAISTAVDNIGGQVAAQFAGDGMTFRQSWSIPMWNIDPDRPVAGTVTFDFDAADANLDTDGNATLKVFGRSVVPGRQVRFQGYGTSSIDGTTGCGATLLDVGLRVPVDLQTGNQPPLIGSGGTTPPPSGGGSSTSRRTSTVASNGFRTFPNSGVRHVRADQSVVQGYIAGVHSTGHWYFPSVTSTLNGATDMSGTLTIRNEHTGSSAGMTIGLRAHNYASNPGSFGSSTWIADIHVGRGQTKTITLPTSVLNGLKDGTIKGFGLSHLTNTSINWYGYFAPTATLRLNYTK